MSAWDFRVLEGNVDRLVLVYGVKGFMLLFITGYLRFKLIRYNPIYSLRMGVYLL